MALSSPELDTVLATVLDGFIIINEMGDIQSFNPAAVEIFGYQPHEVIGKNIKMLMPDPYQANHDRYLAQYRDTGEKKVIGIGEENIARHKSGHCFPMELAVNEMHWEGERYFIGTIKDISERKQSQRQLQDFIEKLKVSNEELDQFAYIASHDLKEPLRGLANNAVFLHEDFAEALGESGQKRLERIQFLCRRMEKLVDNLLYYSRLGHQSLAIEQVNLRQIIDSVIELTIPEELGLNVQLEIGADLPTVVCDVPRVTELFRNLVSNAIKYNQSDPILIEIGVTQVNHPITGELLSPVIYVKDNGIGIDTQFHSDVFRIFKRLNQETDKVRGSGVGLAFVKRIVERHQGSIWLESEPGQGSCFFFTLNMTLEAQ